MFDNRAPIQVPGLSRPTALPPQGGISGKAWGLDVTALFGAMLDEIEHAMLLVDGVNILHANRAARQELEPSADDGRPLFLHNRQVLARRRADGVALEEAVAAAAARGVRKLLNLGSGARRQSVAVVPLGASSSEVSAVLLVLGKRQVCGDLSVYWYARSHGLTQAETSVLQALCKGLGPSDIAREHEVAISTVRTQLAAIRAKTHMASLRDLVNEVACLPPLVHALTGMIAH